MKFLSVILFALITASAAASPYIVSDPYPSSAPQPTEFVITVAGQTTPIVVNAITGSEGVYLKWDISNLTGTKTITVKARNAWGESADSLPFVFTVGVPKTPTGIKLVN